MRIAELGGGCVCCSLLGEFEIAVTEIIRKIAPEIIVVETTGLAEPEALVFDIQEALPQCRLDGVVSVIDADMLVRFPELGHTTRLQIEGADILLLNKIDLVDPKEIDPLEINLREINRTAAIVRPQRERQLHEWCGHRDLRGGHAHLVRAGRASFSASAAADATARRASPWPAPGHYAAAEGEDPHELPIHATQPPRKAPAS